MARWGENLLLRNRGDGTFEGRAAAVGLNVKDHTSSAIFADFDNDGDTDAFLGRTLERSMYLVNENGRFVDRSADLVDGPLPYLASSVSATDYNGDGLLDVYVSTYGAGMVRDSRLPDGLVSEQDNEQLARLFASEEAHDILNGPGPRNVLLTNVGHGRFEVRGLAALSEHVAVDLG